MGRIGVYINLILMALNILPIPPLDGSKIILPFLPPGGQQFLLQAEPYGFVVIFVMAYLGILGHFLAFVLPWILPIFMS